MKVNFVHVLAQSESTGQQRKHPQNDSEIQPDVVMHAWIPVFEGQRLVDL